MSWDCCGAFVDIPELDESFILYVAVIESVFALTVNSRFNSLLLGKFVGALTKAGELEDEVDI